MKTSELRNTGCRAALFWCAAAAPATAQQVIGLTGEDRVAGARLRGGVPAGLDDRRRLGAVRGDRGCGLRRRGPPPCPGPAGPAGPCGGWRRSADPAIGWTGGRPGRVRRSGRHGGFRRRSRGGRGSRPPRVPHLRRRWTVRAHGAHGRTGVASIGRVVAHPGAEAVVGVPTQARVMLFTGAVFNVPVRFPVSHPVVRTNLSGTETGTDTIVEAWLLPIDTEGMDRVGIVNFAPRPASLLPEFSPEFHWGMLPDGGVATVPRMTGPSTCLRRRAGTWAATGRGRWCCRRPSARVVWWRSWRLTSWVCRRWW